MNLGKISANDPLNDTEQFSRDIVQIQETIAKRVVYSSQQYQDEMNQEIDKQAGQQIAGVFREGEKRE